MEPTTVDDMLEDEDSLYENEEGDPEFSELIEDMADTVAEDMKAAQQDDPNPVVPPVVIDDESDHASHRRRKFWRIVNHQRPTEKQS
jgi:hypothetical protein